MIYEDNQVKGVKVETPDGDYTISAKAVILATGGFGANNEMVAKYQPDLKGYDHSCSVGATGDAHQMVASLGGGMENMDHIRVNFTYHREGPNVYYMGTLMNTGAIFVNEKGQRFVNDQGGYGVGMDVVAQGGKGWAVFDQSMVDSIEGVRDYYDLGLYISADSPQELAEKIGVDPAGLQETIGNYQKYVQEGTDPEFGRSMLNLSFDEPPYYACEFTAQVQGTFGGIKTDLDCRVVNAEEEPIEGLFAAGECASVGMYGIGPMPTNVIFGRLSAVKAVEYIDQK